MLSPSIYLRPLKGFGNEVLNLIAGLYFKQYYSVPVYYYLQNSLSTFPHVFNQSSDHIEYIYEKPVNSTEIWIKDYDSIPSKIESIVIFKGFEKWIDQMYGNLEPKLKIALQVNPEFLNYSKRYVGTDYSCLHIRYGSKMCLAAIQSKPVSVVNPYDYLQVIDKLRQNGNLYIVTDSKPIVNKYILSGLDNRTGIKIFNGFNIDSFNLTINAKDYFLGPSMFSYAAACLNPLCQMKQISNRWLVSKPYWNINLDLHYLNDKSILHQIAIDYADSMKTYNQIGGGRVISERRLTNLITNGPIVLEDVYVSDRINIYGTLKFDTLSAEIVEVYGTVYGRSGGFNILNVYGQLSIDRSHSQRLIVVGALDADRIEVNGIAEIVGSVYVRNSIINTFSLITNSARFDNCRIDHLVINNYDNREKRIILYYCQVNRLIVRGNRLRVSINSGTIVNSILNVDLILDPLLF